MTKVLVLYVFHIYNERVKAFISDSLFYDENIDFIIISNDEGVKVEIPGDTLTNVRVMYRKNIGYDFGGWSDALLANNTYRGYDKFIFVNSSVVGPFLPVGYGGRWTDVYLDGLEGNIKLFGSTINTMGDPLNSSHVQSYIFSMDRGTLEYLIRTGIFSSSEYAKDFDEAIEKKEVLMSRKVIENGWNIGSLLPLYRGVDFTFRSKRPEEYGIEFLDDVMYERYRNKLWRDEELVFIKGNRIKVAKSFEGFSNVGGGFYRWLILFAVLIGVWAMAIKSKFSLFRRAYSFFRREYIGWSIILLICVIIYYASFNEGFEDVGGEVGFIVTRCVRKVAHNKQYRECYEAIRRFHPDLKIVFIDSSNKEVLEEYPMENVEIIESENKEGGDYLPYWYLLKRKMFKKAIYLQDSMILNTRIPYESVDDYKFMYEFTPDRAELNEVNALIDNCSKPSELRALYESNKWVGSFGCTMVISSDFLQRVEDTLNITAWNAIITNKKMRMGLERGIALACIYTKGSNEDNSLFGSIYDTQSVKYTSGMNEEDKKQITDPIIKVWNTYTQNER